MRSLCFPLILLSVLPAMAAAQPMAPREPAATRDLGRIDAGEVLTFSPDGQKVYVRLQLRTVNAWAMLAWYWPELVAVPTAALVFLRVRSLVRRRRLAGVEHCAKCEYPLRGLTSDRCPECGLQLTAANRIVGRARNRELAALAILLAAMPIVYHFAGARLMPLRTGPGSWLSWRSHALWEWTSHRDLTLPQWVDIRHRLVEFDRAGGGGRVVWDRPDLWPSNIVFAPDGRTFFAAESPELIGRFDTASGERVAALPIEWPAERERRVHYSLTGLSTSADGKVLRVWAYGGRDHTSVMRAWELETDLALPPDDPRSALPPESTDFSASPPVPAGYSYHDWQWAPTAWNGRLLRQLSTADGQRAIGLVDIGTITWLAILADTKTGADSIVVSPDGRFVAAVDRQLNQLTLYDLSDLGPAP